jgi:hypothetical protein
MEETDVRSIFLVRKRSMPIPFLQAFDLPDSTVSCARRDTTVVAPQALMLLNSPESVRLALLLAERIQKQTGDRPEDQVETLFQLALLRSPDPQERAACVELVNRHRDHHGATATQHQSALWALRDLCRAIINLNEFAYID